MARRIASSVGFQALLGAALSACLWARPAHADSSADAALAQQLFDEARLLMKQGDYATACGKLAHSQALDPGGGTLLNLGICYAKQGRTATAFAELELALARAKAEARADRERTAQKYLDELTPALCHLTLLVPAAANTQGLLVELDGSALEAAQLGLPLAVDPGVHQIRASQPAHQAWSRSVPVDATQAQQNIEIPSLEAELPAPAPLLVTPPAAPAADPAPAGLGLRSNEKKNRASPRADQDSSRWVGYATVGLGAAAVGVGGYFGLRALALKSDSNQSFNGSKCTQSSCMNDWNDAKRAAVYSDVAFGVGLAALGAGAYLLLAPNKRQRAAQGPTLFLAGLRSGAALSVQTEF
jgi:hypothetical protein